MLLIVDIALRGVAVNLDPAVFLEEGEQRIRYSSDPEFSVELISIQASSKRIVRNSSALCHLLEVRVLETQLSECGCLCRLMSTCRLFLLSCSLTVNGVFSW